MFYFTTSCLLTFECEGTMHAEFNIVVSFTVLYLQFQHCAKDMSKVTAQPFILEYIFSPCHIGIYNTLCLTAQVI